MFKLTAKNPWKEYQVFAGWGQRTVGSVGISSRIVLMLVLMLVLVLVFLNAPRSDVHSKGCSPGGSKSLG